MTSPPYEAAVYSTKGGEITRQKNPSRLQNSFSTPFRTQKTIPPISTILPPFFQHLRISCTMSNSNNRQGQQGQGGQGSNTPTPSQQQQHTQSTTEQYPDHAAYNSAGSLQRAGAGVMQQQLGQYYLYMANAQSGQQGQTGQRNQAGRGSPAGSQGGQSSGSSQGR